MLGVFFGSFDPIHENHIKLCQTALTLGCHQVVLVANGDNPLKPQITDIAKRQALIEARLQKIGPENVIAALPSQGRSARQASIMDSPTCARILQYCCNTEERKHMNWSARFALCEKIATMYGYDVHRKTSQISAVSLPNVVQLVGEDSFLQSCKNAGDSVAFAHGRRLMVFPRSGADGPTSGRRICGHSKGSLKSILLQHFGKEISQQQVLIAQDYEEALQHLSSTALRSDIAAWWEKTVGVGELSLPGLDASVAREIVKLGLYNKLGSFFRFQRRVVLAKSQNTPEASQAVNLSNSQSIPIIFFTGRPGSGKSTTAARLATDFGFLCFNGGDAFRELQATNAQITKREATDYVLSCMSQSIQGALAQNRGLTLDCQPREGSDTYAERKVLERFGVRINLLVNLDCSEQMAARRLLARQRSPDDVSRKRRRETYAFEEAVLEFHKPGRECGCILDVDSESQDQEVIYAAILSRVQPLVLSRDFSVGFLPPAK